LGVPPSFYGGLECMGASDKGYSAAALWAEHETCRSLVRKLTSPRRGDAPHLIDSHKHRACDQSVAEGC
jgi:hypothetical protein